MTRKKTTKDFSSKSICRRLLKFSPYGKKEDIEQYSDCIVLSAEDIDLLSVIELEHGISTGRLIWLLYDLDTFIAGQIASLSQIPTPSETKDIIDNLIKLANDLLLFLDSKKIKKLSADKLKIETPFYKPKLSFIGTLENRVQFLFEYASYYFGKDEAIRDLIKSLIFASKALHTALERASLTVKQKISQAALSINNEEKNLIKSIKLDLVTLIKICKAKRICSIKQGRPYEGIIRSMLLRMAHLYKLETGSNPTIFPLNHQMNGKKTQYCTPFYDFIEKLIKILNKFLPEAKTPYEIAAIACTILPEWKDRL